MSQTCCPVSTNSISSFVLAAGCSVNAVAVDLILTHNNISCLVITLCSLWMKSFLQCFGELSSCWCVMISALCPHSVTVRRFAYWSLSSSTFRERRSCRRMSVPPKPRRTLFSLWYFHWNPENLPLSALRTLAALFVLHPPPHCRCCCAANLSDDGKMSSQNCSAGGWKNDFI